MPIMPGMDVHRAQRRSAASLPRHPGQRPCHKRHRAHRAQRCACRRTPLASAAGRLSSNRLITTIKQSPATAPGSGCLREVCAPAVPRARSRIGPAPFDIDYSQQAACEFAIRCSCPASAEIACRSPASLQDAPRSSEADRGGLFYRERLGVDGGAPG